MAILPLHSYFAFNESLKPIAEFVASENTGGIYEVLRVIDGQPLFWEEHLERLFDSADLASLKLVLTKKEIFSVLLRLIEVNGRQNGNLLISYKTNLKSFYIPHSYPTKEDYVHGIKCGILHAERANPNAKVFQTSIREKANQILEKESLYEVILVDEKGLVREGSRSNLFFIRGNTLFTSKGSDVLLGITRQKTIEIATAQGIELSETDLHWSGIGEFEAAFITGTSPKILPVMRIGEQLYNTQHPVLISLMEGYEDMIQRNLTGTLTTTNTLA